MTSRNSLRILYVKNSYVSYMPRQKSRGISIPIMSGDIVSKLHANLKKHLAYSRRGWESTDHPPAIADRVDLFPTRVENPSHEEGIVRGLTFADLPRDAYLTMRVVHTQVAADCRGVCAGVTQFVVTNEHNMIMSRDRAAIYSRTFFALLAETLHGHPPSCAVSFVHVCQYVTDWYTDPSLPARILVEAETRACDWNRSRSTTNNARNWGPTGVLALFARWRM